MADIMNFKDAQIYKDAKRLKKYIAFMAYMDTLTSITQEINYAMGYMAESSVNLKECKKEMQLYIEEAGRTHAIMVTRLAKMHAENLTKMAAYLEQQFEIPPTDEEIYKADKEAEKLPREYREQAEPIIFLTANHYTELVSSYLTEQPKEEAQHDTERPTET